MTRSQKRVLDAILSPRSVAVIGASTRPDSVGRAVFANILFHNYQGIVYPINPKTRSILGVRAYASVLDVPDEIDLAVVIVPAPIVPQVLGECGQKGIHGAVVISAGFKEVGTEGAQLERQTKEVAQTHQISLIGPNCLGIINTDASVSLNATFARSMPRAGNIAFISQSGAVGVAALEYAQGENIGLSKFISVGNKADLNESDLLLALRDDPQTAVILLYLEDLEDPKGFIQLAREITSEQQKPILAIKSGRTREGAKAASSHTGALAGSDEVYDSLFMQCGVLRVESLEELFEYAIAFAQQPPPRGNRVAIVTNAGGPGIMATDACVRHGLQLAELRAQTRQELRRQLPTAASVQNPVDLIGDAREDRYGHALRAVLADANVDACLVICTPQMMADLEAIAHVVAQSASNEKPVLACFMALEQIGNALQILEGAKIPHYRFPEDAARALAQMAQYMTWVHRPRTEYKLFSDVDRAQAQEIISRARSEGRRFLPEPEAHALLQAYGFPVLKFHLARTQQQAARAAADMGYPVVLKIVSPQIVHKVDVGGVKLNLQDEAAVRQAHRELISSVSAAHPQARIWGVFVQQFISGGKEVILGLKRDRHFGPLLLFGLGGIYVEALRDVTFRIAPIRELGAYRMIQQIRSFKILEGYRGEKPSDIEAIAECLLRLSQLSQEIEEIEELDINPLIVFPQGQGVRVVDARILLKQDGSSH
jgi:acetyl coenzyme A synthetase (ADP forming)-like protein